ncbi:hypothetical protein [Aquimarina intermedia]|uniref:Uncharacterized protein n=1 Tax=Aquimarina intermedia TaxID=350814 RepID=A0A5S5CGA2_9FLAO|nr:hypothetical protein [Aquimarina intermedia]TYP77043.1 hypothetical protein BD809_101190 [Aquimarina intermedia]
MKKLLITIICITGFEYQTMNGQDFDFSELSQTTIENFRCVITAENYTYYGLSSAKSLEQIIIDEPIYHYGVQLNALQRYNEQQNPEELVSMMDFVSIPLIDKQTNEVETFLMINKRNEQYQTTGMGKIPFVKEFMGFKKEFQADREMRLIRVPAVNIAYAGIVVDGLLNLIPISYVQKDVTPPPVSVIFAELAKTIEGGEDVPN